MSDALFVLLLLFYFTFLVLCAQEDAPCNRTVQSALISSFVCNFCSSSAFSVLALRPQLNAEGVECELETHPHELCPKANARVSRPALQNRNSDGVPFSFRVFSYRKFLKKKYLRVW